MHLYFWILDEVVWSLDTKINCYILHFLRLMDMALGHTIDSSGVNTNQSKAGSEVTQFVFWFLCNGNYAVLSERRDTLRVKQPDSVSYHCRFHLVHHLLLPMAQSTHSPCTSQSLYHTASFTSSEYAKLG